MASLLTLVGATAIPVLIPGPNVVLGMVANPKTLLFHAAFLPQFVSTDGTSSGQILLVAAIFLSVLLLGDMLWALSAGAARPLLDRFATARNRLSGGFLVAAGVGLALSQRDT